MNDLTALTSMFFVILFYGFLFVALIYFIVKRIKDRDKENFEKRDN